ncbi:MAG: T9SS type A sorting domain-containing protein [Candidatus Electryonea clarkiae]|nr:T9SS type A sorting domain-containing protein [Candidatus Electryonea clarkiae]MDP8287337.1 T9SS type A sorting domain-containing protein [Candidatus Electryonea clarkiae]
MLKRRTIVYFLILSILILTNSVYGEKRELTQEQGALMRAEYEAMKAAHQSNELDEILLEETFDDGIPDDWGNVDHSEAGWVWVLLEENGVLPYGGDVGYPIEDSAPLVFIDSDAAGNEDVETSIVTPEIDVRDYMEVVLEFDHILRNYDPSGSEAWVEISTDGGDNWDEVEYWELTIGDEDMENARIQDYPLELELDDFLEDAETMIIRFRYAAVFQYFWAIDNIVITAEERIIMPGPTELEAEHVGDGEVNLSWTAYEEEMNDFVEYLIYLDDVQVGSTEEVTFTHNLPTLGTWRYTVTAFWDEGESHPTNSADVVWDDDVTSIESVQTDDELIGSVVHLTGIVTQPTNSTNIANFDMYIQDVSGYGLQVFDVEPVEPQNNLNRGDELVVTGTVAESNGITMIVDFGYAILSEGNDIPNPVYRRTGVMAANNEMEGKWAVIEGTLGSDPGDDGSYELSVDDGSGPVLVSILEGANLDLSQFSQDDFINVNGVISIENDEVRIVPSLQEDISSETGVRDSESLILPSEFTILSAYPNPFNPSLKVMINMPEADLMNVSVYDILGREVAILAQGLFSSGQHTFLFEANGLAGGIYFIRLVSDKHGMQMQKVVLTR